MATWKKVPGLPGYEASTDGEIRCNETGHVTKGGDAGRYLKVEVARDGKRPLEYVHILVCTAYHGKPKEGEVVLHKDDDAKNNRPSNLKWGTQSENIQQAYDRDRVPGKKASTEDYLEFRDIVGTLESALIHAERLDIAIESVDTSIDMITQVPNDPVVLRMAFTTLNQAHRTTGIERVSGASLEAFTGVSSLEDLAKFSEAAKKVAKQVAKTIQESWAKLVTWFKEYVGKVGERCKQLRNSVRDSKTVGMTKAAADVALESIRTARARVKDAVASLRTAGKETTPESVAVITEVSKAIVPTTKAVTMDATAFIADTSSTDGADKATMDRLVTETAALNDDMGKLTAAADSIMSNATKVMTDPKSGGPTAMDKDGKTKDASVNNAKKGEYTKLAAAIQSISRTTSTLTQKALGGVTKSISMTIPAPGDDKKE